MSGSTFGTHFKIMTWGESHGPGVGIVIDGCPAGLSLSEKDIQPFLDRRKPGQSRYTTSRAESDHAEILSGLFEGRTTGTPISLMVHNKDQRSKDYSDIASCYRPGHADYTFDAKYGFRDYRGGGRSSGRETIGRVAAGAVAVKLLEEFGISFHTYIKSIGPVKIRSSMEEATAYLEQCMAAGDSAGGVIEGVVTGLPAGIGEPVFDKLDANLAKAIFSIGAVKGFEIGDGFATAKATGLSNNDGFIYDEQGNIQKLTNHSGGVLGGISDGAPLIFRAAIKPTPSISAKQSTVDKNGENIPITIKGRHDPVIVPRAVVVVEAMAALTIADLYLANLSARLDQLT